VHWGAQPIQIFDSIRELVSLWRTR
jgi:hypothetical protein